MRFLFILAALALASCAGRQVVDGSPAASLKVADAAMQGGAPDMALRVADAVLEKEPGNVAALLHQGAALAVLGRGSEAALSFQRALALEPGSTTARLGLGRLRLTTDPAQAETLFAQVLKQHPANVTALTDRGIALDLLGHHAEAEASYRAALAQQPDSTAAEVDLALSLALAGHAHQAVGMLQPLAAGSGANRRVQDDLAVALAMSGETRAASEVLAPELDKSQITAAISAYQALQPSP